MGLGSFLGLFFMDSTITFESLESKTDRGHPVFNEVRFIPGTQKDIWLMRQTHKGLDPERNTWDRLAIIVDKSKETSVAEFYQLQPGAIDLRPEDLYLSQEARPLKASCFSCHASGPRALRPQFGSYSVGLKDRARILIWNLRIKAYGPLIGREGVHFEEGRSFRSTDDFASQPLKLKSCQFCHRSSGLRAPLSFEQVGTVNFLVEQNLMPPFPFSISQEDRDFIERLQR